MSMKHSEYRQRLREEREEIRNTLENEFKFFSATNEFRDGMLADIISLMRRYDGIERILKRYQADDAPVSAEPSVVLDGPAVEGDTLHFTGEAAPRG